MRRTLVSVALIVVGCQKGGLIELDTGTLPVDDSGVTQTVETGTVDTGVTTQEPNMSFVLGAITPGATFSLTWVNPMEEIFVYGSTTFNSTAEEGLLELYLPEPHADEMIVIDATAGWSLAFYVPALHDDSNGDGSVNVLETVYGVGQYWLFFSNLSMPDIGIGYGWNGLVIGTDQFIPPFELPIDENLLPNDSIWIQGSVSVVFDNFEDLRLAAIPLTMFMGLPTATLVYDEALHRSWTVNIETAPPLDHLIDSGDLNSSYAVEYLAVYDDDNSNFSYDQDEEVLTGVCRDGRSASLVYMAAPRDLAGNVVYMFQGLQPGWFVMESWIAPDGSERNEFLTSPETAYFEIGEPCWAD